ncbi:3560_t:CDS:2, partial [Acaulospora colombiana]
MTSQNSKRSAAYKAVDVHLNSSTKIIGIGSGSTVVFVIERILQRGGLKKIEGEKLSLLDVLSSLKKLGCPNPSLRMAKAKAGPILTDNGNFVIDANFGPLDGSKLFDNGSKNTPKDILNQIKLLTGVVE